MNFYELTTIRLDERHNFLNTHEDLIKMGRKFWKIIKIEGTVNKIIYQIFYSTQSSCKLQTGSRV